MKILAIDNHPIFLDGLSQGIQQLDNSIIIEKATTSRQALLSIKSDACPDMILVDMTLPGMENMKLLGTLAQCRYQVPFVILSSVVNPHIILRTLDAGACGFIPKTFSASQLLYALRSIMQGNIFLPEDVTSQVSHLLKQQQTIQSPVNEDSTGYRITPRQTDVLALMSKGLSNRRIAATLNVSEHTVKSHIKTLFILLKASNRTACVKRAEQLNILLPDTTDVDS